MNTPYKLNRSGFTLIELIISISIASLLVLATTSVILVSSKTLEMSNSLAAKSSAAIRRANIIVADLKMAVDFLEQSPTKLSFTVADRDADGQVETIVYEWKGAPDYAIFKTIDFSASLEPPTSVAVVENVTLVEFGYLMRTWGVDDTSQNYSPAELVFSQDDDPDGSLNKVLLVVNDKTNLNSEELARATWLTAEGFVIEPISDNDSATSFNSALARNNLVLVAPTVNSGDLDDKLVDASIGVVVENTKFAEQLEIGQQNSDKKNFEVIDIQDVYHFISAEYLPGGQRLFDSEQDTRALSSHASELSPDLRTLAHWATGPGLSILNPGDDAYSPETTTATFGSTKNHSNVSSSTQYMFQHVASRFELTSKARITDVSAYLLSKGNTSTRFGIYSDNTTQPLALLGQTEVVNLTLEANPKWVTANVEGEVILEPGNYWLAASVENNLQFYTGPNDGFIFCSGLNGQRSAADSDVAAVDGMMTNWPLDSRQQTCEISIHANYEEIPLVAGRRVQLPWGESSFTFASLTSVGQDLLKKSLLWAGDPSPEDSSSPFAINLAESHDQYISPEEIPPNAQGWRIVRVAVSIKPNSDNSSGAVVFKLFEADPNQEPTAVLLQQTEPIEVGTWPGDDFAWFDIPFQATDKIDVDTGVCLVISGTSSGADDAYLQMDATTTFIPPLGIDLFGTSVTRLDARVYVFGQFLDEGNN